MSTRASIFYTNNGTHIYSETNEWDEARKGFNIYYTAFWREYNEVTVTYNNPGVDAIVIEPKKGAKISIDIADTFEWSSDFEGFCIGIYPNTKSAEIVKNIKEI